MALGDREPEPEPVLVAGSIPVAPPHPIEGGQIGGGDTLPSVFDVDSRLAVVVGQTNVDLRSRWRVVERGDQGATEVRASSSIKSRRVPAAAV